MEMNNSFKIEKSLYMMIALVAIIGFLFIIIRSDLILSHGYMKEEKKLSAPIENKEDLSGYKRSSFLLLEGDDQPELAKTLKNNLENIGKNVTQQQIGEGSIVTDHTDGIIIATEKIDELKDIQALLDYVKSGGSLFFAIRPSPGTALSALYQQVGIVEVGGFIETTGLELTETMIGQANSMSFESEDIRNSSLALRVGKQATVYAKSTDDLPLLWSTNYGEGMFVFFNGTMFTDPSQGGLFIKGIQLMVPQFIYPVINAKVTALEGFPFPVPNGQHEGMTNEEMLRNIIWADLQRVEAKYDLNYTASYVSAFDMLTKKPGRDELAKMQENTVLYGRELLRMGGEIGVQGYHNAPLTEVSKSDTKEQMETTAEQLEGALPGYHVSTYIPVDQNEPLAHLPFIHEVFPELKAVLANVEQPSMNDGVAVLPKQLNGFVDDPALKWEAFNGLLMSGFISESLHLQSLLLEDEDIDRSLLQFETQQKELKNSFPWLRNQTISDVAKGVENHVNTVVYEEHTKNGITFHLNQIQEPAYFYFSSNRKVESTENCVVTTIGPNLYLVETNHLTFHIRLGE